MSVSLSNALLFFLRLISVRRALSLYFLEGPGAPFSEYAPSPSARASEPLRSPLSGPVQKRFRMLVGLSLLWRSCSSEMSVLAPELFLSLWGRQATPTGLLRKHELTERGPCA